MMKSHLFLFFLLLLAVGCQAASDPTTTPLLTETAVTTEVDMTTSETPTFQNPVIRRNFPDPGIIRVDDTYFAYSTNAAGRNVPVASSEDLVNWQNLGEAMPALPSWVDLSNSNVWAPEVMEINGRYNLYFTARDKTSNRQCVGMAVSDKPEGKFKDVGDTPFICQAEEGGSIDASPFRDADGKLYLYWKNDGNCCNQPTYIYVQEMSDDGLALLGEPTRLIRNEKAWEAHVIEAPTMWIHDGRYYLFYSANDFGGPPYAVGYAVCETAVGPCEKAAENPILNSVLAGDGPPVIGPGHQFIIESKAGDLWLAYHAWQVTTSGTRGDARLMWLDRLVFEDGKPVIKGPTTEPQPVP